MINLYKYKTKNKSEIKFIEQHFCVYFTDLHIIYYSTTDKIVRKIKILSLDNIKLYNKIKKIIKYSTISDIQDVLTAQFSFEISKEIDKYIIGDLMKMYKPRKLLTKKLRKFTFSHKKKKTIYNIKKYKKQKNHQLKIDGFLFSVIEFYFFIKGFDLLFYSQFH